MSVEGQAMNASQHPAQTISPAPVKSAAEADALVKHFVDIMDKLIAVVQQETELVRAGRLRESAKVTDLKGSLAGLYVADTLRLRASQSYLATALPDMTIALRVRHEAFRSLLQTNLTVLATAHAVSEGIVRGVSDEMARKSVPQTYGATGRASTPGRNAPPPLAVSRML
jgi:hypothetical protein